MQWTPPVELSEREEKICARLTKQRRFFPFLRRIRRRLFNDDFQARLAAMYSDSPRGNPPQPPAFLAAVVLLQAYTRCSDFDAVSSATHDARWRMVLDCMDAEEPPFGESTLADFRARLVRSGTAPLLLRRTVELAKETRDFGYKQVASLRVAIDSVPIDGAGKVEDTINLLGRALRLLLHAVAAFVALAPTEVAAQARLPVLVAPSIKAGLDLDWHAPNATGTALALLLEHMERLTTWMQERAPQGVGTLRMEAARERVEQVVTQDTEPDGAGGRRITEGVARDRLISLSDPEMRHGRKSKSQLIDGYKQYVATDLDQGLTLAAGVLPANAPEAQGADKLAAELAVHGEVSELAIDTAFLSSALTATVRARADGAVVCRPLRPARRGLFTKQDFVIDLTARTVRCPSGHLAVIQETQARFATTTCTSCPLREKCQPPKVGQGRMIAVHPQEAFFQEARAAQATPRGRARLRERTAVEHTVAHLRNREGRFARYRGVAKNDFDVQRIEAVNNLNVIALRLRRCGWEEVFEEVA